MTETISPMAETGRKHAREVMHSAARLVNHAGGTRKADAATTLSTSLQLVLTTALVDGYDPQEVYSALAGALAWSVQRLAPEDQDGVLAAMVRATVDQMARIDAPMVEAAPLN